MPLQATSGAASYDAFGGGVPVVPTYIEDVFSTWLYTGNGSTQTINNGIDLAGKGALIWTKCRSDSALAHRLNDTERGITNRLFSNLTNAQSASATSITATSSTGYTVGSENGFNENTKTFASWTFRKQPKFFDVVTYTGTGSVRTVSHNLGSAPGFIVIKRTDAADEWFCYHRSIGAGSVIYLNLTNASNSAPNMWNNTAPTSTVFTLGTDTGVNANGATYVAYLFAHDAGGFGLTGTDNVISCGSFTGNGSAGQQITLGYEPQFIILKQTNAADTWRMYDNMRGMGIGGSSVTLQPNSSNNESTDNYPYINATGFTTGAITSGTFIYIAIRRGPMRTPTTGTSVFSPIAAANGTTTQNTTGFPVDFQLSKLRNTAGEGPYAVDRLRRVSTNTTGNNTGNLVTSSTGAEGTDTNTLSLFWNNTGFQTPNYYGGSDPAIYWNFRRAPGFMDVVCYTGTGSARTVTHNLGVAPEMMIVRSRSAAANWEVYVAALGPTKYLRLDLTSAAGTYSDFWNDTAPTASVFTVATDADVNGSGRTQIAYLFASCPGVSKVGSYTGTGATSIQNIECGFTAGARFVLIKRTDGAGGWYVWDTARGISTGTDPYLLLNSTAAEVTNTDMIEPFSGGFAIDPNMATDDIWRNGSTYIFLAIA